MLQMNSSNIEQGELVVADILFAEQVRAKRRLALVVSNTEFNTESQDIVVSKVTSHGGNTPFDIKFTSEDTANKNLQKDSTIMVDFPVVIMKEKIHARPDKIKEEKLGEVKQKIRELYGV